MTMTTIREVLRKHLPAYLKASRKEKGRILDHLVATLDKNRRSIIQAFSRMRKRDPWKIPPRKRGRKPFYGPEVTEALRTVWDAAGEICGELLYPVITEYVAILLRDAMWPHGEEATAKLLSMSEGTVKNRVGDFKKARHKKKGLSATRPSRLKEIIPVFFGPWEDKPPGFGQIDTVVHCGGSLAGDMAFSLQYVDAATYWSMRRAQWNKGEKVTQENLVFIYDRLPFTLLGMHPDSGGEFINWILKRWCDSKAIELSRSRSGKKNDNMFIEERNGHVIRKHLGYRRLDNPAVVPLMNEFYAVLDLYVNHFVPCRRTKDKKRVGSKYIRTYEKAETPYRKVLRHPLISDDVKERLRKEHETLNPLKLKRELDRLRTMIFETQKDYGNSKEI